MAKQTLNNGENLLQHRTKVNDNFTEVYDIANDAATDAGSAITAAGDAQSTANAAATLAAAAQPKENGKGLSANDYTTAEKNKLGALPTNSDLTTILATKQNSATGFGLIAESEKARLSLITSGQNFIQRTLRSDNLLTGVTNGVTYFYYQTTSAAGVPIFQNAPVEANTSYVFEAWVRATSPTASTAGVRFGTSAPAGATTWWMGFGETTGVTVFTGTSPVATGDGIKGQSFVTTTAITSLEAGRFILIKGRLIVGSTAGNFNILGAPTTEGQQANFFNDISYLYLIKESGQANTSPTDVSYTNGGTLLFSDPMTAITSQYSATGWAAATGGLSPTSIGLSNRLILTRQYAIADRSFSFKVRLNTGNRLAVISSFNQSDNPPSGASGSMFELSVPDAAVKLYNGYADNTTVPAVLTSYPFTFATDRDYLVEVVINDNDFKSSVYLTDTLTGVRTFIYSDIANDRRWNDYIGWASFAGTNILINSIRVNTPVKNPKVAFYGDSITAARTTPLLPRQGASYLVATTIGSNSYVSGRSSGVIAGVRARLQTEVAVLPTSARPKYIVLNIGTNNTDAEIQAQYQALHDDVVALGCVPIINNVPARSDSIAKNTTLAGFRTTNNRRGVLLDVATSLNNNTASGPDTANYIDATHPNATLHQAMARRHPVDIPELFDN